MELGFRVKSLSLGAATTTTSRGVSTGSFRASGASGARAKATIDLYQTVASARACLRDRVRKCGSREPSAEAPLVGGDLGADFRPASYGSIRRSSTRRFMARPEDVEFDAIGISGPYPRARIRSNATPCSERKALTDSARAAES